MSRIAEIENSLRNRCEEKMPSYARPTFYEFNESFPLTAAEKIDYRTLESEHVRVGRYQPKESGRIRQNSVKKKQPMQQSFLS